MGREETAKAERAELRRAVVDEALGRLGEMEYRLDRQKVVVNKQGRALEALAQMITAMEAENRARDVMILRVSLRFWQRWYLAIVGYADRLHAVGAKAVTDGQRRDRSTLRVSRLEDPASWDPSDAPPALTADNPGVPDISTAPEAAQRAAALDRASMRPDHIHQYMKDGPFLYSCTVPDCGKRATLDEIANDASFLSDLDRKAVADADQSSAQLLTKT